MALSNWETQDPTIDSLVSVYVQLEVVVPVKLD